MSTTPTPTTTNPTTSAAPAPNPAEPATPPNRNEIAAKLVAHLSAQAQEGEVSAPPASPLGTPEPTQAPPTEGDGDAATPPTPTAAERHAARVRESMQQRMQERIARESQRRDDPPPAPRQPEPSRQVVATEVLAQMRRDPRGMTAALREAGFDVPRLLHELTNDALSPGSARAVALAEDQQAEARRANERLDKLMAEQQSREQENAIIREQAAFAHHAEAQDEGAPLYPLLSALDPYDRVRIGQLAAEALGARGVPYDRESVAVEAESYLARLARSIGVVPPSKGQEPRAPAEKPPASTPAPKTTPAAKAKRPPADIAAEGAPPSPPLTYAQKQQRLIAEIQNRTRS